MPDNQHAAPASDVAPRFSVVVPAYNASETLAETLDAILAQSFADWECVVVDDGSTDTTRTLAEEYAHRDARFRVLHQQNQGSAGAYNTGVRGAGGDFVVLCSADDILLPEHLATMSSFIDDEPGYDIYSSNGYFWHPGVSQELVYTTPDRERVCSWTLEEVIMWCFYSVGAAYRREWFERVGGYRLGVFGEDYDFWMRAMALGATHRYTPAALSLHRKTDTQKSADVERAYRSDIRLVSDLAAEFDLSDSQREAVRNCIATRERYIEQMHATGQPVATPTLTSRVAGRLRRMLGR